MHNRHFIVINKEDKEQAEFEVDTILTEFGTDDNYFQIMDTIEVSADMEQADRERVESILNNLKGYTDERSSKIGQEIAYAQNNASDDTPFAYYTLSTLYKELYHLKMLNKYGTEFTIENLCSNKNNMHFQDYKYDEFGITDLRYTDKEDFEHTYLVEIDMHS